jgi:hypothetical protein
MPLPAATRDPHQTEDGTREDDEAREQWHKKFAAIVKKQGQKQVQA